MEIAHIYPLCHPIVKKQLMKQRKKNIFYK